MSAFTDYRLVYLPNINPETLMEKMNDTRFLHDYYHYQNVRRWAFERLFYWAIFFL